LSSTSIAGTRPLAVLLRQQALRDQRTQIQGKVHQQLVAALFGEKVDDPVERLIAAVGM
jgi:hypothetical protein